MKKVAILTINDNQNMGNRLQNYATQQTLKKYGVIVETINNQLGIVGKNVAKQKIKNLIKQISKIGKFERDKKFIDFNKNIKFSKIYIDIDNIPENLDMYYDYFITGSDQVWNPNFYRLTQIDLLEFANDYKRNSFSASFGVSSLSDDEKQRVKNALQKFNAISVREEAGKEIIQDVTGRTDVEVLVDPTMLLSAKEWDMVAKKPKKLKFDKYILNYFLGELSEKRKKEIERVAKENNCKIINILDKNGPFYATGPSEFLYLEKHAFLICTDSFHSSVFAILYNRPFLVFEREDSNASMNSRIETLLSKFELKDRYCNGKISGKLLKCNYKNSHMILEKEKFKAEVFLKKIIGI